MGYSKSNYKRISDEYRQKYNHALESERARRAEVHAKIPELRELDAKLGSVGFEIMTAVLRSDGTLEAVKRKNEELNAERAALLKAHGYPSDYTDIKYECERCKDTGYCDDLMMCDCMKRALVMAGYESSGIANLLNSQTFENFDLKYYAQKPEILARMTSNYQSMKDFAEGFDDKTYGNFIFIGGTGLGKTHLSSAVARVIIDKGFDVLYANAVKMISDFEHQKYGNSAYGSSAEDIDRYYSADLLIIDDLGTEVGNQFTVSCVYTIINTRMNLKKSTIISTNLLQNELTQKYPDRIISRLFGEYSVRFFEGTDIRRQKRFG
jgi:DNA replication protein DnaC